MRHHTNGRPQSPGSPFSQRCPQSGEDAFPNLADRLVALATYAVQHENQGWCPEHPEDRSRDPECLACTWIEDVRRG